LFDIQTKKGLLMVEIFTDSCSDLRPEQIAEHHLHIVPLYVHFDDQAFLDGVTISPPELFERVKQTGSLPKTSAPSMQTFVDSFAPADELVYVGISSRLSASIQSALLAKAELGNKEIYVIDSLTLSSAIGLLALKAAQLRDEGKSAREISDELKTWVPKTHCAFVIDTLDYLYMGGRCSAMSKVVGSMLKIRPIIEVAPDGTLGVKTKVGGSRKKALSALLDDFKSNISTIDLSRVFITHTSSNEDAEALKDELLKIAPIKEVCISNAGATIASHCGPGTIGILYLNK